MKIAMEVAANIPTITTVPRMRREAAPAPVANHSGADPKMKANEVIRMGRKRKRAKNCDWYREQHREWQRPTLVERGQNQEHKNQRQSEYPRRCSRGLPLLIRKIGPVVTHLPAAFALPLLQARP